MKPRDPTDLARVNPSAGPLIDALDALYAVLEAVEESASPMDLSIAVHHARACWDNLLVRDSDSERAASDSIEQFKRLPDDPAVIRHSWKPT